MKKFILFGFFLITLSLNATHNRAGEILYKRIAPFTNVAGSVTVQVYTYSITVVKYTDYGPGIADRCLDTVYFGDGAKGAALRSNGTSSCNCGTFGGTTIGCGSLIVNKPDYRVKYSVYTIIHTYPGPGIYLIISSDPNRNQGVHNIPNSVNQPFTLESLLIIGSLGTNSSPVLTNPPIDEATLGVCFTHNPGAVDSDGDSLSYQITNCLSPGYFDPETGVNGSFTINPVTGLLSWCSPQFIDEYNIAILVKEWRKNSLGVPQMIGSVLRDMQVLVKYGTVGINENKTFETISVYPNPFNEKLEIDLGSNKYKQVEALVYTNDGKLVFKNLVENAQEKLNLSLNSLPSGIYTLRLKTENKILYRKIVKD